MQDSKPTSATNQADNLEKPTSNTPANLATDNADSNYPNQANESKGAGSPYGGTQSADGKAPDGNQQIHSGAADKASDATLPEGQGDEYDTQASYGNKGDNKEGDDNGGDDARGSSVS